MAGIIVVAFAAFSPQALAAQQAPTRQEISRVSPSGNYLAARHAGAQRDATAAATYFRAALRADPRNNEILNSAFISVLADGDIDEAVRLAERILQVDRNDRVARLVVGVRALKQKQYLVARQNIAQSVRGPITDLAAALLVGWSFHGSNDTKSAIETISRLTGADWYAIFKELHSGLILELANKPKDAGKHFEAAYKSDGTALRVVEAYGRWASRHAASGEALKIFQTFDKSLPRHPLIVDEMTAINAGKKLAPLVDSPQAGAAEVLYGLGASLGRRGGQDLGLVYLQLALYLVPNHPLALLSLADLYETMKKPQLAVLIYERMPTESPLRRNSEIQLAINLDALDRTDEAIRRLEQSIAANPQDLEAIIALGNIQRGRKNYAACASTYGKGIDTLKSPERNHWTIFYFRGICDERAKNWSAAEADLKKALELFPEQPHVLNYLGYSWVDQGINLDEGMRMIRRAVEQRPDDGYIVDSLGWAHYRVGNYDDAAKQLERAVELKPEDPTINDHLGDTYWKIGRTLEARFQWTHARDLKPEPEELAKIEEKLRSGLPDETSSAASAEKAKKPGNGG
jgi:tetratricopeptide (TPR) repeat protein